MKEDTEVKQNSVRDEGILCKEQSKISRAALVAAQKLELKKWMIVEQLGCNKGQYYGGQKC